MLQQLELIRSIPCPCPLPSAPPARPLKFTLIGCTVLYREVCHLTACSPHTITHRWLPQGLHDLGSTRMAARLQAEIDAIPPGSCDAILLAYALCNNGIAGLRSPHARLVVPRAHDCITLLLGSRACYSACFGAHPGTYFLSAGWIEHDDETADPDSGLSIQEQIGLGRSREELAAAYGEENVDYLLEMLGNPTRHYSRLCYLELPFEPDNRFRDEARRRATEKGWEFETRPVDLSLLARLLNGEWDQDFLVLEPGSSIEPSHTGEILCARPAPCA